MNRAWVWVIFFKIEIKEKKREESKKKKMVDMRYDSVDCLGWGIWLSYGQW
jgi:hypothetical protein